MVVVILGVSSSFPFFTTFLASFDLVLTLSIAAAAHDCPYQRA
jgi:hypothetical protein